MQARFRQEDPQGPLQKGRGSRNEFEGRQALWQEGEETVMYNTNIHL